MSAAAQPKKNRILWLEALRIIAAFLVIVNHTNSDVFKVSNPSEVSWHLSILWYYVSKLAVPVYVMITGGLMLSRQDSWKKVLSRVVRVLLALLAASYVYFLYDCWAHWGLWPRGIRLDILLGKIVRMEITDGFWYLYFYLAMMLTMPLMSIWICWSFPAADSRSHCRHRLSCGSRVPDQGHSSWPPSSPWPATCLTAASPGSNIYQCCTGSADGSRRKHHRSSPRRPRCDASPSWA